MIKSSYEHTKCDSKVWLCIALGTLLFLNCVQVQAEQHRVLLLASKDLPTYQKVIQSFSDQVDTTKAQLTIIMSPSSLPLESLPDYDLIVPIGTQATRSILQQQPNTSVLSTFIPHSTFDTLANTESSRKSLQEHRLSAIYLEQPFLRQLKLLSQIQPEVSKIGTVLGPSSASEQTNMEQAVSEMSWQLNISHLREDDNPIEVLTPVISNSDAFLAVPDRSIFNRSTAKWILLMSFRQRIPLIAYSKRYVDAGAIAAVYSTPETVGQETAAWVNRWLTTSEGLPSPAYPEYFDISINKATARSLRLKLPSKSMIKEAMQLP
ncbi:ABC transporter substrate-binding protein [Motiliproteus sp. MSK22-1]|uniref:ABC transporter substrate-binding protein n=1 Tax=Motiliproteus sp. MSK22-1 TaxID=1897630 RepID=UPI000976D871|nr:ABC transporter substrate binding protein [Motiliproteus sp. MSK22-1]OMH39651.1 hypothetical protein BGP75_02095 [Motiliproteus sp. MSK22-1]